MSANPVARPQSRRAFIGALAALPAGAAASAATPETGTAGSSDAELLAWADRRDVLLAEKRRLQPSYDVAFRAFCTAGAHLQPDGADVEERHRELMKIGKETGFQGHPIIPVEDSIGALEDKIMAARPSTLAGLAAQARVLAWIFLSEEDFTENPEDLDWDKWVLLTLVRNISTLAGFDIQRQATLSFCRRWES